MLHPAVRFVIWSVLGAMLVIVAVSVQLASRSPSSPHPPSQPFGGSTPTPWGPLSVPDRQMLITVRQANLWEGPSGELAAQKASSPAVREVGRKLGVEHAQLDIDLRAVTDRLGMRLPNEPSDAQKQWMSELESASGPGYDKVFINRVRSAHGEVMPLVEGVRAGTGNELVRQVAIEGGQYIARHMGYLESTNLVDYSLFPTSTAPPTRVATVFGYELPVTLLLWVAGVLVSAAALHATLLPAPWRRGAREPVRAGATVGGTRARRRRRTGQHSGARPSPPVLVGLPPHPPGSSPPAPPRSIGSAWRTAPPGTDSTGTAPAPPEVGAPVRARTGGRRC